MKIFFPGRARARAEHEPGNSGDSGSRGNRGSRGALHSLGGDGIERAEDPEIARLKIEFGFIASSQPQVSRRAWVEGVLCRLRALWYEKRTSYGTDTLLAAAAELQHQQTVYAKLVAHYTGYLFLQLAEESPPHLQVDWKAGPGKAKLVLRYPAPPRYPDHLKLRIQILRRGEVYFDKRDVAGENSTQGRMIQWDWSLRQEEEWQALEFEEGGDYHAFFKEGEVFQFRAFFATLSGIESFPTETKVGVPRGLHDECSQKLAAALAGGGDYGLEAMAHCPLPTSGWSERDARSVARPSRSSRDVWGGRRSRSRLPRRDKRRSRSPHVSRGWRNRGARSGERFRSKD
jgi:hypothetical protein